jgi:predicted SAM-dependent methyltransferase
LLVRALAASGVLSQRQQNFARVAAQAGIEWADVTRHIPAPNDSVEVIYSSHMLEHLDRAAARAFLLEVRRVLVPGGVLRLAVPDLALLVESYASSGDGDAFITDTLLTRPHPRTALAKLRWVIVGDRGHAWMYDSRSLVALVTALDFDAVQAVPAGVTGIADPGELDLREQEGQSLYVEARKPLPRVAY